MMASRPVKSSAVERFWRAESEGMGVSSFSGDASLGGGVVLACSSSSFSLTFSAGDSVSGSASTSVLGLVDGVSLSLGVDGEDDVEGAEGMVLEVAAGTEVALVLLDHGFLLFDFLPTGFLPGVWEMGEVLLDILVG